MTNEDAPFDEASMLFEVVYLRQQNMLPTSLVICGKVKVLSCCVDSDKSRQNTELPM